MTFELVPLLQIQRDLYRIPRGLERFRAYLRTMIGPGEADIRLPPLVAMNPMGKDHVPALLDAYLALDAEAIAARALADAAAALASEPGPFRVGLVLADDRMGGWTNRAASEFGLRFEIGPLLRRGWLCTTFWTSEPATAAAVRSEVLAAAHRAAYVVRHGPAQTLRERLAQEGHVLARSEPAGLDVDAEEVAYTRAVIEPHLDATDMRTAVECLFGDAFARTLGFTPRGLSPRAGFALALHDARADA